MLLFLARAYRWLALKWAARQEHYLNRVAEMQRRAAVSKNNSAEAIALSDDAFADYKLEVRRGYEQQLVGAALAVERAEENYKRTCAEVTDKMAALNNKTL
jgi:hypothetical protein